MTYLTEPQKLLPQYRDPVIARVKASINAERDRRASSIGNFEWNGAQWQADAAAQRNFEGLLLARQPPVSFVPPTGFDMWDAENVRHVVDTVETLDALLAAYSAHMLTQRGAIFRGARNAKDALAELTLDQLMTYNATAW